MSPANHEIPSRRPMGIPQPPPPPLLPPHDVYDAPAGLSEQQKRGVFFLALTVIACSVALVIVAGGTLLVALGRAAPSIQAGRTLAELPPRPFYSGRPDHDRTPFFWPLTDEKLGDLEDRPLGEIPDEFWSWYARSHYWGERPSHDDYAWRRLAGYDTSP